MSPPSPPSPPLGPPRVSGPSRRNATQPAPPSPARTFSWDSSTKPAMGPSRLPGRPCRQPWRSPRAAGGRPPLASSEGAGGAQALEQRDVGLLRAGPRRAGRHRRPPPPRPGRRPRCRPARRLSPRPLPALRRVGRRRALRAADERAPPTPRSAAAAAAGGGPGGRHPPAADRPPPRPPPRRVHHPGRAVCDPRPETARRADRRPQPGRPPAGCGDRDRAPAQSGLARPPARTGRRPAHPDPQGPGGHRRRLRRRRGHGGGRPVARQALGRVPDGAGDGRLSPLRAQRAPPQGDRAPRRGPRREPGHRGLAGLEQAPVRAAGRDQGGRVRDGLGPPPARGTSRAPRRYGDPVSVARRTNPWPTGPGAGGPTPGSGPTAPAPSERAQAWVGTMAGAGALGGVVVSHRGAPPPRVGPRRVDRLAREEAEAALLAPGATLAAGAGNRAVEEEPDPLRTCFERDRDRILHATAFRRLAGKTQVFVFPADHQRTRLTHALEVAQVATSVARALGLNVALAEAIALGHDCGHGPGGHASEDAFHPFLAEGYHHALWGADVVLAPLNLCTETLDGIRHHSWSLPTPLTPEGVVVSWADRCAYSAHDFEDAAHAGIVASSELPPVVQEVAGTSRSDQLETFVHALVAGTAEAGTVGMQAEAAEALAALRAFNYEHIYTRPESVAQGEAVIAVLRALVTWFAEDPARLPIGAAGPPGSDPLRAAVTYVGGMTDRYAFEPAVRRLGWRRDRPPRGIDTPPPADRPS